MRGVKAGRWYVLVFVRLLLLLFLLLFVESLPVKVGLRRVRVPGLAGNVDLDIHLDLRGCVRMGMSSPSRFFLLELIIAAVGGLAHARYLRFRFRFRFHFHFHFCAAEVLNPPFSFVAGSHNPAEMDAWGYLVDRCDRGCASCCCCLRSFWFIHVGACACGHGTS